MNVPTRLGRVCSWWSSYLFPKPKASLILSSSQAEALPSQVTCLEPEVTARATPPPGGSHQRQASLHQPARSRFESQLRLLWEASGSAPLGLASESGERELHSQSLSGFFQCRAADALPPCSAGTEESPWDHEASCVIVSCELSWPGGRRGSVSARLLCHLHYLLSPPPRSTQNTWVL